jgi:DNA-binding transcriptional regulator GbsR (MarR family)
MSANINGVGLDAPEKLVIEAISELFLRAGLRSSSGLIWGALYLAPAPLGATEIRARTGLSSGAVSMGLNELLSLEIVHRSVEEGSRRFCYAVESEMWLIIKRIFKNRTRKQLLDPVLRIREAEQAMSADPSNTPSSEFVLEQVRYLLRLGEFALDLFDAFLERTRVEMKAARKWLSVSGKLGGEPLSRLRRRLNATRDGA